MASTNTPVPINAAEANDQEVFDSTIIPSEGQVSQDQLPGGNTSEAPVHAGELNSIDIYFFTQFMYLTNFVWDVSMSPGQLLWYVPIHPEFVHQWLGHIAKMYNVFAGGFDFALTVAATAFHGGKGIIVRLPPNIHPSSLRTMADVTAFPYFIFDPRMVQTVVKSAMDQRPIMYHYLPYNAKDKNSFGGYLAVYVMLPLITSSTGSTSINIQVLSKPSRDFMFSQIKPISSQTVNIYKPDGLNDSLDFRLEKTGPVFMSRITGMIALTATEIKEISKETLNCIKLDRKPMNGELFRRLEAKPRFKSIQFKKEEVFSHDLETIKPPDSAEAIEWSVKSASAFTFGTISVDTDKNYDNKYPAFLSTDVILEVFPKKTLVKTSVPLVVRGLLRKKLPSDTASWGPYVLEYKGSDDLGLHIQYPPYQLVNNNLDYLMYHEPEQLEELVFTFLEQPTFDVVMQPYAPPIKESIILFHTPSGDVAQPQEVKEYILSKTLEETYSPGMSLVFELFDDLVALPLMPVRLHYNGYFTTNAVTKNLEFKFENPQRYYMVYIGSLPETTPMVSGKLPLATSQQYNQNMAMSRIASSSLV